MPAQANVPVARRQPLAVVNVLAFAVLLATTSSGGVAAQGLDAGSRINGQAAPPNLLSNTTFTSNIAGWSGGSPGVWNVADAAGRPGSGSLAVTHDLSTGTRSIYQCAPVTAGAAYTAAAQYFLPASAPAGAAALLGLNFYPGPNCTGTGFGSSTAGVIRDRWSPISIASLAPGGTQSVLVHLGAWKETASPQPFAVFHDNAYLRKSKCGTGRYSLCLAGERFHVTAYSRLPSGGPLNAAGTAPFTADSGSFWFFDPVNLELSVKILDACTVNNKFWVFAAGTTTLEVQLNVLDTVTGALQKYVHPPGQPFVTIADTGAFNCS
jgi:hypothetical protein